MHARVSYRSKIGLMTKRHTGFPKKKKKKVLMIITDTLNCVTSTEVAGPTSHS